MSDFEVHPIGTTNEIKYSRELANAIKDLIDSHGEGIVPISVLQPYKRLCGQYIKQVQSEAA